MSGEVTPLEKGKAALNEHEDGHQPEAQPLAVEDCERVREVVYDIGTEESESGWRQELKWANLPPPRCPSDRKSVV